MKKVLCILFLISAFGNFFVDSLWIQLKNSTDNEGKKANAEEEHDSHSEYFKSLGGVYHFKYDTGNIQHQSFRGEKRYAQGTVTGYYGYVDPDGILRITEYIADQYGYRQRTTLRFPVVNQ